MNIGRPEPKHDIAVSTVPPLKMDFTFLIATAAGAIATLAAASVAALIVVRSLSSFRKWTNKDNERTKKPRKKVSFMRPTNGKQERHEESGEK